MQRLSTVLVKAFRDLGVAEKVYGIAALFAVMTALLVVMAIQSVRLQTAYREDLVAPATAALNIERVNGLIFAIVMESRGIYMSTDPAKAKPFGDALTARNRELGKVVEQWQTGILPDDAARFTTFKKRIDQFIEFRRELVRRAVEISPAAGREWGDNDANRSLRTALNEDLSAIAEIYAERAKTVAELGDRTRLAAWYLALLGVGAMIMAGLNVLVMKRSVVAPLSDITEATDLIAAGRIEAAIPHVTRRDEIGRLAHAVQNFRDAVSRNLQLEEQEIGITKQRDEAMGQRDKLNDKYYAAKWQISAAFNNMPQGVIMLNAAAEVLVINDQYRKMYGLPPEIKSGTLHSGISCNAGSGAVCFPATPPTIWPRSSRALQSRSPQSAKLNLPMDGWCGFRSSQCPAEAGLPRMTTVPSNAACSESLSGPKCCS
jgi:HAMP domain-containing protein